MRDPDRIEKMLDRIEELWDKYPDLRLGQLIMIIVSQADRFKSVANPDIFNIEDDEMMTLMDKMLYKDREETISRVIEKLESFWLLSGYDFGSVISSINITASHLPASQLNDERLEKALDILLEGLNEKPFD